MTIMMRASLTTLDNPYDPVDDFDNWYKFDMDHGYSTCSYLARVARTSDQLTDAENEREVNRAIDEIVKYDMSGLYIKVTKNE